MRCRKGRNSTGGSDTESIIPLNISKPAKRNVLHILPHLGGGVGSVLLHLLAHDDFNNNTVACWDTANTRTIESLNNAGIPWHAEMHGKTNALLSLMAAADIVVMHFWNHPLAYDFLVRHPLPPVRIVCWGHVAGLYPPNVFTPKLFEYFDRFVFTTPLSLNAAEGTGYSQADKLSVIISTRGVEHFAAVKPRPHRGCVIGYVGTADYAKLHPDFVSMCARIAQAIPDVTFHVVTNDSQEHLIEDAIRLGIRDRLVFRRNVADVRTSLELFDFFGYPLNPRHFGTAEQVLQEAMASGLVPLILDNPAEKHIVCGQGIVANNPDDYVSQAIAISHDHQKRAAMGAKAREFAFGRYTLSGLRQAWHQLYSETMAYPKRERRWDGPPHPSPYEVFLESLGSHAALFTMPEPERTENLRRLGTDPTWRSASKGTPFQYARFLPDDPDLETICRVMRGGDSV